METLEEFSRKKQGQKVALSTSVMPDIIPLHRELLINDFKKGEKVAEFCGVDEISHIFSWRRGFQYCWYGWANDGKSEFYRYLMILHAMKYGSKHVIWSPESMDGEYLDGHVKPIAHYNDFFKDIIWILTGSTVYHSVNKKYNVPMITETDLMRLLSWCEKHFIMISPKDKTPDGVINLLGNIYDRYGFDSVLIDPFKNTEKGRKESFLRDDQYLDQLFARTKMFAIETNSVFSWIAHPRLRQGEKRNKQLEREIFDIHGNIIAYQGDHYQIPPEKDNIMGGGAWDNGMDVIMRVHRPFPVMTSKDDYKSDIVWLTNEKQKKQETTNGKGMYTNIRYDIRKRRYLFNNTDPIAQILGDRSNKSIDSNPF